MAPGTPARPRTRALTTGERHGARLAGVALLAMTVVALPAARLANGAVPQDGADGILPRVLVGTAFLVIAALDVAVGWGLYVLLRARAHPSAHATLVSRGGYAVLLAAAAARLLWPGGDGLVGFLADWSLALLVFGLHLLIAAVALWRSRVVPWVVPAATALAGAAYLFDDALSRFTDVTWRGALVPLMLGELLLMGWLLLVSRRLPVNRPSR